MELELNEATDPNKGGDKSYVKSGSGCVRNLSNGGSCAGRCFQSVTN